MKNIAETECMYSCTAGNAFSNLCPSEVGGEN